MKKIFRTLKKRISSFRKQFRSNLHMSIYFLISIIVYSSFIYTFINPIFVLKIIRYIIIIIFLITLLIFELGNRKFLKRSEGNGIIYGGRGKGKGILLQKVANSHKKIYSNVYMGNNTEIINIKDYIQSIGDNTIIDTINGSIKVVKKLEQFEGVPVLVDDTTLYFPNFEDKLLKSEYPSMPLTLAINRHLYNSHMIITTQDLERPYKILRELQSDYYIKAIKTSGWGYFWLSIPLLRKFVSVKYLYYENLNPALEGITPFKAVGAINEGTKKVYLSSGQATKEEFNARYGEVKYGRIFISKNRLHYDTRYFHEVFFGTKAPNTIT